MKTKKRLWLFALLPLSLILLLLARHVDGFTEAVLYPLYIPAASVFGFVTSLAPFSLAELVLFLLPLALIAYLVVSAVRSKRRKDGSLPRCLLNIGCGVSVGCFLFVFFCSVNYYRPPLAERMGLDAGGSTVEELYRACVILAVEANELRAGMDTVGGLDMQALHTGAAAVGEELGAPRLTGVRPKGLLLSRLMSELHLGGFFFPLTVEANINRDMPDVQLSATAAHELSHLMGYMREDEANFLGYYICRQSGDPSTVYSGTILAFRYVLSALRGADYELYLAVAEMLDEQVIEDINEIAAFWSGFHSRLVTVSSNVNNAYLRMNDQEDGVQSYGRMVDLVVAYLCG